MIIALVAQLDRVLGFEPRCRGFESLRARHLILLKSNGWRLNFQLSYCPNFTLWGFCGDCVDLTLFYPQNSELFTFMPALNN
jgi:hypothetical protein